MRLFARPKIEVPAWRACSVPSAEYCSSAAMRCFRLLMELGSPMSRRDSNCATVSARAVLPGCPGTNTSSLAAAPAAFHFR